MKINAKKGGSGGGGGGGGGGGRGVGDKGKQRIDIPTLKMSSLAKPQLQTP